MSKASKASQRVKQAGEGPGTGLAECTALLLD